MSNFNFLENIFKVSETKNKDLNRNACKEEKRQKDSWTDKE